MKHSWRIRPYVEGDEHQILRLRQTVFGDIDSVRMHLTTWNWQFRNNPAGKGWIYVAEDHQEIVGQYAAIPTRITWKGQTYMAAFSCDTMVHPKYRRQGMFVTLADALYRLIAEESGVHMVWGFPNNRSLPGFVSRLGWKVMAQYPLRVAPLRPLRMLQPYCRCIPAHIQSPANVSVLRPFRIGLGLELHPVFNFSAETDVIWNRHKPFSRIIQIRDRRYLEWRYHEVPEFGYMVFVIRHHDCPAGYLVMRFLNLEGQYFGALMDIFPLPVIDNRITREILGFVRRFCHMNDAGFATFLLPEQFRNFLWRIGAITVPHRLTPRPWRLGCRFTSDSPIAFALPNDWHITYGDTDIL